MVLFPHAKINLGLRVTNRRADGFHDIETVFYPLPWQDALEAVPAEQPGFRQNGLALDTSPENNLCQQAIDLLAVDFDIPAYDVFLYKAIPSGAGLGGGSSDAAFTLKLINELADLGLSQQQLEQYAARLGSDCPFFIKGQPVAATGRGEVMQPVDLSLSGYTIAVVFPDVKVSTGWAYSQITPKESSAPVQELLQQPVEKWAGTVVNDFEEPVMSAYPAIRQVKDKLLEKSALFAMMSGSGSAVFGLFEGEVDEKVLAEEVGVERAFLWVGKV